MKAEDWIPFSKQLPEPAQTVLAISDQGSISRLAFYSGLENNGWTHWQPWADPPKTDPFEEWWRSRPTSWCPGGHKALAKVAWDAAREAFGQDNSSPKP